MRARFCARKVHAGTSLLEALVAIAVVGFGLIAIGKFQSLMIENSGFTREQSIALRLAQSKIEDLKAFETLANASGKKSFESVASGSDSVVAGVVTFNRTWTVTNRTTPGEFKEIVVSVAWTDLKGVARTLQTASLLAAESPLALAGTIKNFTKPGNPVLPFNRVLKVPIPAIDQGDGTSVFTPPGGTGVEIALDNETGNVVGVTGEGITTSCDPESSVKCFLLSGYLSFGSGSTAPSVSESSDINFKLVSTDDASNLPDHQCWDDSHFAAGDKAYSGYVTYTCVVGSNGAVSDGGESRPAWSGTMRLVLNGAGGEPYGWDTTNSTTKICRYNGTMHPYGAVTETLASQNYRAVKGNQECPSSPPQSQFQP